MSCSIEKTTIFFVNYFSLQLSSVTHYIYIYIYIYYIYHIYIYVYVYYLYIYYIYICIYIYVVISDPQHTECSNLPEARKA